MLDLGMKLEAVKLAFGIFNRGKLGIFGRSNRPKSFGKFREAVSVRIPNNKFWRKSFEQPPLSHRFKFSSTVFSQFARLGFSPEHVAHELQAITYPENRYSHTKQGRVGLGSILCQNTGWTTRKNNARRRKLL